MTVIYVSGPISGLPEKVYADNFRRAEVALEGLDYFVLNPLRISACSGESCKSGLLFEDGQYKHTWQCYMRHDIAAFALKADEFALLPGWENSKGSVCEMQIAEALGLPIHYLNEKGRVQ